MDKTYSIKPRLTHTKVLSTKLFVRLNVKLFNSQINKLKSGIKSCTKLNLSSNVVGNPKREINFSNKLLLTHTFRGFDISRHHKAFVNG